MRDSTRRLLDARTAGNPPPAKDLVAVNRASAAAPRAERLGPDWVSTTTFVATGSDGPRNLGQLMAGLAAATIALAADPPGPVIECGADDCVVLYLRTDPRKLWHSRRCGNRIRAARSYARHRP